jgi:hypothetical protein
MATAFGASLRRARRNAHDPERGGLLTQERLAELISVHTERPGFPTAPTVSNWERGAARPQGGDRGLLWALVAVLLQCGGLIDQCDADAFLTCGGYAPLGGEEAQRLRALVPDIMGVRGEGLKPLILPMPRGQAVQQEAREPGPHQPVLVAVRHQSMEPIPERSIQGALASAFAGCELIELVIDQTDLFRNNRLVDPLEAARRQHDLEQRLARLLAEYPHAHVAYHGIAHIPLLFFAGYRLSNRRRVALYDFDRRGGTWDLLHRGGEQPALRVSGLPEGVVTTRGDVVVRMSISYRVRPEVVADVIPEPIGELDLALEQPVPDAITSEEHVWVCAGVFRGAMDEIHERFPNARGIHIFYSGPPPLAFACGQHVSKTIHPRLVVYNYVASDVPSYSWGLDLTRDVDAPDFLVRPAARRWDS